MKIAFFTVLVTQTLAVVFAWPLGLQHAGLTLATSVGACCNAALLLWLLRRRGFYRPEPGWPKFLARVLVAVAALAAVIAGTMGADGMWLASGVGYKVGRLALVIAAAGVVYFGALYAMGFRLAHFARREATPPPDVPPADVGDGL